MKLETVKVETNEATGAPIQSIKVEASGSHELPIQIEVFVYLKMKGNFCYSNIFVVFHLVITSFVEPSFEQVGNHYILEK